MVYLVLNIYFLSKWEACIIVIYFWRKCFFVILTCRFFYLFPLHYRPLLISTVLNKSSVPLSLSTLFSAGESNKKSLIIAIICSLTPKEGASAVLLSSSAVWRTIFVSRKHLKKRYRLCTKQAVYLEKIDGCCSLKCCPNRSALSGLLKFLTDQICRFRSYVWAPFVSRPKKTVKSIQSGADFACNGIAWIILYVILYLVMQSNLKPLTSRCHASLQIVGRIIIAASPVSLSVSHCWFLAPTVGEVVTSTRENVLLLLWLISMRRLCCCWWLTFAKLLLRRR